MYDLLSMSMHCNRKNYLLFCCNFCWSLIDLGYLKIKPMNEMKLLLCVFFSNYNTNKQSNNPDFSVQHHLWQHVD